MTQIVKIRFYLRCKYEGAFLEDKVLKNEETLQRHRVAAHFDIFPIISKEEFGLSLFSLSFFSASSLVVLFNHLKSEIVFEILISRRKKREDNILKQRGTDLGFFVLNFSGCRAVKNKGNAHNFKRCET